MLDNTFRIAVDPLFPPNDGFSMKKGAIGTEQCPENRFDLIFDERVDGPALLEKYGQIGKKEREEIQSINELEGSEDEQENEAEADQGEPDEPDDDPEAADPVEPDDALEEIQEGEEDALKLEEDENTDAE